MPFVLVVPKLDCILNRASSELSRGEQNRPSTCWSVSSAQCVFGLPWIQPGIPWGAHFQQDWALPAHSSPVSCTGYSSQGKKFAFLLRSWLVGIEARPFGVSGSALILQNLQICWGCVIDGNTGWKEPWWQSMVINMGWLPSKHIFSEVLHSQIIRAPSISSLNRHLSKTTWITVWMVLFSLFTVEAA